MDDAPVPLPLPVLRCEHGVEAPVKQFVDNIQDIMIGRSLMAARNFLMRSEGKE
jgi:hypothetical protein